MHVADKMNEVADGFGALQGIGGLVFQYGALLFDGAGHAAFGAAVFAQVPLVLPARNIDVVPGTIFAFVAHVIGQVEASTSRSVVELPHQRFSFGSIGLVAHKFLEKLLGFRRQVVFCDQSDSLMAFAAQASAEGAALARSPKVPASKTNLRFMILPQENLPSAARLTVELVRRFPPLPRFQALSQRPMGLHDSV